MTLSQSVRKRELAQQCNNSLSEKLLIWIERDSCWRDKDYIFFPRFFGEPCLLPSDYHFPGHEGWTFKEQLCFPLQISPSKPLSLRLQVYNLFYYRGLAT